MRDNLVAAIFDEAVGSRNRNVAGIPVGMLSTQFNISGWDKITQTLGAGLDLSL